MNGGKKRNLVLVQDYYLNKNPISNIFYRFGDINQLTVALPKRETFEKFRPLRFHPSFVDTSFMHTRRCHILINPTYRYEAIKRFMPKVRTGLIGKVQRCVVILIDVVYPTSS